MLIGSLVGGADGERWHTKLVRRALDPSIGPDAAVGTAPPVEREAPVVEEESDDRSTWRHLLHH
jgi:hypothetical protein